MSSALLCKSCSLGSTGIYTKKYRAQELLPDISQFKTVGKKISSATLNRLNGTLMSNGRTINVKVNIIAFLTYFYFHWFFYSEDRI